VPRVGGEILGAAVVAAAETASIAIECHRSARLGERTRPPPYHLGKTGEGEHVGHAVIIQHAYSYLPIGVDHAPHEEHGVRFQIVQEDEERVVRAKLVVRRTRMSVLAWPQPGRVFPDRNSMFTTDQRA
jgi:hypothetical protein